MGEPVVAILVPILNRPHRIEPLLANIHEATPEPHSVYFAASDQASIDELDRLGAAYIRDNGDTYANRINTLFDFCNEPYCFLAADDYQFHFGWLPNIMRTMDQHPNSSGICVANDLYNAAGTAFLVARTYVQEFGAVVDEPGHVLCSQYVHSFVDDELRETAKHYGRFSRASDCIVEHLHYGNGKAPHDDTYARGEASMTQGRAMFTSRAHLWAELSPA